MNTRYAFAPPVIVEIRNFDCGTDGVDEVFVMVGTNGILSSATGHKCRCDKAYVMEIQNMDGTKATEDTVRSDHDKNFVYTVGATVEVPDFDDNRWSECAPGIHFFIDRRAAVEY